MKRHEREARLRRIWQRFGAVLRLIRAADGRQAVRNSLIALLDGPQEPTLCRALPLKHLRIQELHEAGFNVADFRFWLRGKLDLNELRELHKIHGGLSSRNFTGERENEPSPRLPFLYGQDTWEKIAAFCIENNRLYHTLVNEVVPVETTEYRGNIVLMGGGRYTVLYSRYPGTPRDIDFRAGTPKGFEVVRGELYESLPADVPSAIGDLLQRLKDFRADFRPMTFEFSVHDRPVGRRKLCWILWEWRGGSTHDLDVAVAQLLARSPACRLSIDLPQPKTAPTPIRFAVYR